MKKILSIFMLLTYLFFLFPIQTNAQTLGQYKLELDELERKEKETKEKLKFTEKEIEQLSSEIDNIYVELASIVGEITEKEKENVELQEEIDATDEEIKKIMSAYQISSGNSFYLEYLFGATTITDFIIRYSVTEQLTKYNDDLIKKMNKNIEENKKMQEELADKSEKLKNKQVSLSEKQGKLKYSINYLEDTYVSILDEIEDSREIIRLYEEAGCKDNEELTTCVVKTIPSDTKFLLPLETGYVTSKYQTTTRYVYDAKGRLVVYGPHLAYDISVSTGTGTKVYAAANGKVVYSGWIDTGGNYICIHHNINQIGYTTCYAHLSVRYVSKGDLVSQKTVIGLMGSTGKYTTGPHVHFSIGKGLRYVESKFAWINPTTVMSIPSSWTNRNR